jgi:hypothetical protein
LFFLSQLISIFLNRKASWTLDVRENQFAIIAMLLEFMVIISPLHSFVIGPCISTLVVNGVRFEGPTSMEGLSNSLKGKL